MLDSIKLVALLLLLSQTAASITVDINGQSTTYALSDSTALNADAQSFTASGSGTITQDKPKATVQMAFQDATIKSDPTGISLDGTAILDERCLAAIASGYSLSMQAAGGEFALVARSMGARNPGTNRYLYPNPKRVVVDPLTFTMKTDSRFRATGLDKAKTVYAFFDACHTWQEVVAQDLFANGMWVDSSESSPQWAEAPNGVNSLAWKFPTPGFERHVAMAGIWSDASGKIIDADITFNGAYGWNMDGINGGGTYDFQGIATHEVGHCIGLADLYNVPGYEAFTDEIMCNAEKASRELGPGDKMGAQMLYGMA